MANFNIKKNIRIVVGDVEFSVTAPAAKIQQISDLIFELGGSAVCIGHFTLSSQQYAEFASKSTCIITTN